MIQELKDKFSTFWWILWTGYGSLDETRRALEEEVRRFNGRVIWDDESHG